MKIKHLICGIGISAVLLLSGCGPKDYGFSPPERYEEPPAIELTEQEQGILDLLSGVDSPESRQIVADLPVEAKAGLVTLATPAKSALTKVMKQKNAWRAIVRTHNQQADQRLNEMLKNAGIKIRTVELEPQKRF